MAAAVRDAGFLSGLAGGLAGVNLFDPNPGATKELVAAAATLDALSAEGAAQQREAAGAPKRRRRGAA